MTVFIFKCLHLHSDKRVAFLQRKISFRTAICSRSGETNDKVRVFLISWHGGRTKLLVSLMLWLDKTDQSCMVPKWEIGGESFVN